MATLVSCNEVKNKEWLTKSGFLESPEEPDLSGVRKGMDARSCRCVRRVGRLVKDVEKMRRKELKLPG